MRCLWVCLVGLFLNAEVQRAQIIQTYIYRPTKGEFKQEKKNDAIYLLIQSKDLMEFMIATHPRDRMEKQVVRFNQAYTEFKGSAQSIRTYANTHNKLNFNFSYNVYDLEYSGQSTYRVKNAIEPISDPDQCHFMIQKTLTSLIDGKKDFVINLDSQQYFGKVLSTHYYLQCVKK